MQTEGENAELKGEGTYTDQGYLVYIFTVRDAGSEMFTKQYYILDDYKTIHHRCGGSFRLIFSAEIEGTFQCGEIFLCESRAGKGCSAGQYFGKCRKK